MSKYLYFGIPDKWASICILGPLEAYENFWQYGTWKVDLCVNFVELNETMMDSFW